MLAAHWGPVEIRAYNRTHWIFSCSCARIYNINSTCEIKVNFASFEMEINISSVSALEIPPLVARCIHFSTKCIAIPKSVRDATLAIRESLTHERKPGNPSQTQHRPVERCYRPETTSQPPHTDKWALWPTSTQPTLLIGALLLRMCSRWYVQLVISTPRRTEVTPKSAHSLPEADGSFVVLVCIPIIGSWCWWTPDPSSSSENALSIH